MIAAHRRAHRRIHAGLWPVVFVLVAVALFTRRPVDAPTDWPAFLAEAEAERARAIAASGAAAKSEAGPLWTRDDAFGTWPARLALFADGTVELRPRRPLDRPELLLYWVPGAFTSDVLPVDARLLGRVVGTHAHRFMLPAKAGSLVVYSLGHGAIVASARLEPSTPTAPSVPAESNDHAAGRPADHSTDHPTLHPVAP